MNLIDPKTLQRLIDTDPWPYETEAENICYCFDADINDGRQEVAPGLFANVMPAIAIPSRKEAWINIKEAKAWIAKQEKQQ